MPAPPRHPSWRSLLRYLAAIVGLLAACALLAPTARSGTRSQLQQREHRQVVSLHRYVGTLTFFRRHPRLARSKVGRREVRRARIWVRVIRRELAETRAQLKPSLPAWWLEQAACIRSHEGAWTSNTGNGYYGAYQFLLGTWRSVGGRGYPHLASPAEQTFRAHLVWLRDGGSWREWGTAGMCGLG